MSTGDARRSQSATIFDTFRKEKDSTNHGNKPPSKRLREDGNPAILVSEASTTTLITDNLKEDQNFLIAPTFAEQHKEQQAMKLNCLKDKMHDINLIENFHCNASNQNYYLKV